MKASPWRRVRAAAIALAITGLAALAFECYLAPAALLDWTLAASFCG